MVNREEVIKGLECCFNDICEECPYKGVVGCMSNGLAKNALELLKNEPHTSTEDTTYQRLMAINRDLIERNTNLAEEAQKLARFNDNLTKLCEALIKKVYANEKS